MTTRIRALGLLLSLAFAATPSSSTEADNTFQRISGHYEAARQALLADSLEGLGKHGLEIQRLALDLHESFSAEKAGVPEEAAPAFRDLLLEISSAGESLGAATNLESARDAFFEVSKPLGRYRKLVEVSDTVVMYCPMAKKAWIQPDSPPGNPYLGSEMPNCGRAIAD